MEDIKLCRICLVTDVKMYDLQTYPLHTYFTSLGCNHLSIANSHPYACYECAELLKKYYFFRQRCFQTRIILNGLLDHSGKIHSLDLNRIDRKYQLLSTNLTKCTIPNDSIQNIVHTDIVKQETENKCYKKFKNVYEIATFKEESISVLLSADQQFCSDDDDEPLSIHKKIKEDEEVQIKEDTDGGDVDFTQEPFLNVDADELSHSPPPIKKKRGRPRKSKSLRKHYKPDHGKSFMDNRLDFEDYITVINLSVEEQLEEINKRKESANYLNATYKCELCYKGFIDTDAWKHHVSKHSPSNGDIECPICKFRFKTNRDYQKHTSIHEKKYACKSCPYVSCNTTQAKQHQGWHKGITYKCKFCEDVFTIWTSYMSHVRIKHPSEFICGICGYSFVSKLGLAMHKSMMHKDIMEKGEDLAEGGPFCKECDVKFISVKAYKRHMIMSTKHTKDTTIINGCRTCGETFDTSEECRLHHRKEHARKRPRNYGKSTPSIIFPAKCEHCPEMIPNGREHWAHYRRAHPDKKYPIQKNYVCDICGKSFRGNAFLLYHKRTHSDERAYKCAQCGKAFHNRHNLHVHEKTHSDARPYPCSVCLKAFKVKAALDRHHRIHTGQKPYECEVCGKAFTQSNSRKLHVITVHLKQPTPYNSRRRSKNVVKETPSQQFIY